MVFSTPGRIAAVACACLLATACAGGTEHAGSNTPVLIGWDGQPVSSDTTTTSPIAIPSTTVVSAPARVLRAPGPISLPFADEREPTEIQVGSSAELPRTTAAGIRIESSSETFDFGDGDRDAVLFSAGHVSGSVGLYLHPDDLLSDAVATDTVAWASSGGVVMVIFEVDPTVALMSLESLDGDVDQVEATTEQIAILAVPGDGTDGVSATAFDDAGTVVATCAPAGEFGFITCAPPS